MKKVTIMSLLAAVTVILAGCGSTEINLNDYASVTFGSYDGMGTATVFPTVIL